MLPGKLCIGILEEDNPLKAYFRLKPLLVEREGKYVVFDDVESYPEEGCIRIVPDKNESGHFKARMRRMGRYCVLDLREHVGENDKIRPNKNYHGDESEKNAHIVYSDVVREPAEDMIFEIISEDVEAGVWNGEAPGTLRLLRGQDLETWAYTPATEDEPGQISPDGKKLAEEELQRFEVPGFAGQMLSFAIRLPSVVSLANDFSAAREESRVNAAMEIQRQENDAPREAATASEKPWISRDPQPKPLPPHGHMSPIKQALAVQSGLNPKRNRSLQEIIEEKWRHSRVDQLGHPVPGDAMGCPVENPLDAALEALRKAWRIPEIRDRLVNSIAEMAEFSGALDDCRRALSNSALRRELEDLEAERLKSLTALDQLRRDKRKLRETFKQEIREEEAAALRDAVEKTQRAQAELEKYEAAADEARKAAEFAQDAFAALNDGRFEEKLREFALTSRAVELLAHPLKEEKVKMLPSEDTPNRAEWISRVKRAFAAEGLEIDDVQAANLLICAALSDRLLLSGEAAGDKCIVGGALGCALGAQTSGRYAEFANGCVRDARLRIEALAEECDLPTVVLVRNANCAPDGMIDCGLDASNDLLVISALSDNGIGFPVSPEMLDRGFMIRLNPVSAQTPWHVEMTSVGDFSAVRMSALRETFLSDAPLPIDLENRMQKIRAELAMYNVRISRHSLNLMWRYCASLLAAVDISAEEALDYAFAQKALPCILAEASVECLMNLKNILIGLPRCLALLEKPLPIFI